MFVHHFVWVGNDRLAGYYFRFAERDDVILDCPYQASFKIFPFNCCLHGFLFSPFGGQTLVCSPCSRIGWKHTGKRQNDGLWDSPTRTILFATGLDSVFSNTGADFITSQSVNGGAWLFVFVHHGMVANTIVKMIFRLDRFILPATWISC